MKKIAVIITTYNIEYSFDFLSGICDFYKDKDVQLVIAQTKLPHEKYGLFDYQYWNNMEFLKSKDIDAIIVATGVFCASKDFTKADFIQYLKNYTDKTIVSVSIDLELPNSYTVMSDCEGAYLEIVTHLKTVHNCKNIGFMSANSTKSEEALERYRSFIHAMRINELEVDKKYTLDGKFIHTDAEENMLATFSSKEEIPYDAIVCANDEMASGVISALNKLGVDVPKDIKVIGFDDAAIALCSHPKLSTISQQINVLGNSAASYCYALLNGEKHSLVDNKFYAKLKPKYRQSCGCIDIKNSEGIYINDKKEFCHENNDLNASLNNFYANIDEKNNIITLMDMLKGANSLRQLFFNLRFITGLSGMSEMFVYLYDEPISVDRDEDPDLNKKVELYMHVDDERNIETFRPGIFFETKDKLFVGEEGLAIVPGNYIIQPIFAGESIYGYVVCRLKGYKFADYNVSLKIIVSSIAQAFDYTQKLNEAEKLENQNEILKISNNVLNKESKMDELTEVLNRRGFIDLGQRTLDLMQEMNSAGVIFFADMDGLKTINDTYGHNMGDVAIKLQAEVLKEVFRSSDVIGRIGGDEFGIVALGMLVDQIEAIKERIDELNEQAAKVNNLPFKLSLSIGGVGLESSTVLAKLLTEADKRMYREKIRKHILRK